VKITPLERAILANQYRILEIVNPEEAEYYRQTRLIVENGYEMGYSEVTKHIAEETLDEKVCREVMDVLDMYRHITFSYNKLTDKSGITADYVQFPGFDGNNESALLGYVEFLLDEQKGWQELHRVGGYNSHTEMRDRYRRQMAEWRHMRRRDDLGAADIRRILEA
jgi:uncharacterized protein